MSDSATFPPLAPRAHPPIVQEALDALTFLLATGMDAHKIAETIGVGWRSVHRWSRGQHAPGSIAPCRALIAERKRAEEAGAVIVSESAESATVESAA